MATQRTKTSRDAVKFDGIIAAARRFVDDLVARDERLQAAAAEGSAVAALVAPLGLGPELVATAALHPLVREGAFKPEALAGGPLDALVAPLAELLNFGRFRLPSDWQPGEALATAQSQALRKLLMGLVSDPRLVVVRIAEHLYRLRELAHADVGERRECATETLEIFAPLANRLGVWQLKWELEDLAFRALHPEDYARIARYLNEKRTSRVAAVEKLRRIFTEELAANGITAEVSGRPKHIYSIWRKMQRKHCDLDQIFDVEAVRVLVDSVRDCYAVLGIVHNRWSWLPGEFDDYIANPKRNNYQSLHTAVVGPGGRVVEVQIRTHDMHRASELGVAAHWRYKEGGTAGGDAAEQKVRLLRQVIDGDEDDDLLDRIRGELMEDRVYAFTPQGDVVGMPAGATPLDFAYHVHTGIGHRCRGARVNGRIVPLTYTVKNGDRIEIITGKEERPSRDWLSSQSGYLQAPRSRAKVRAWFRLQAREDNQRQGREILERELARLNLKDVAAEAVATRLKQANPGDLYVALGAGDITPQALARSLQQVRAPVAAEPVLSETRPARVASADSRLAIRGVDNLLSHLARCCHPVAPEEVVGYITKGSGVSIHRRNCGNFRNLESTHPERVIEVEWGDADSAFAVGIVVEAYDRYGLLRDIVSVLADMRVGITGSRSWTDRAKLQATFEIEISVPELSILSRAMARLEQIPNVFAVRRKA